MKAVVCTRYGPAEVLQIRDVPRPVPRDRDVLIKIRAVAVNASEFLIRSGAPKARLRLRVLLRIVIGLRRPRRSIMGLALAGEVVAIGKRVTSFHVGDRVFAMTGMRGGGYAQYVRLPEGKLVAHSPSNLTDEEAAAIPYGGIIALHFLRKANIRPGQRVLVYGASGAIGTCALQIAKHYGAHVTAVCGTSNLEWVASLGADAVLDYMREPTPGLGRYDLVLDAAGRMKTSALKDACKAALTPEGRFISVDDELPRLRPDSLIVLKELVEAGKLVPVIDRRYSLDEIVEAHRYAEQRHKKGNVVLSVAHTDA